VGRNFRQKGTDFLRFMCDRKWPLCVFEHLRRYERISIGNCHFWRMESLWPKISSKRGHPPQIILRVIKLDDSCYKNIARSCYRFVAMHAFDRRVQTDQRTDRQMLEIPRLHCCRAVKIDITLKTWKLPAIIWKSTYRILLSGSSPHTKCLHHSRAVNTWNYSNDFGYYSVVPL